MAASTETELRLSMDPVPAEARRDEAASSSAIERETMDRPGWVLFICWRRQRNAFQILKSRRKRRMLELPPGPAGPAQIR